MRALKADPNFAVFSLIGPSGGCPPGGAAPRLTELVQQFGGNGLAVGLCDDPALALQRLAALLAWFVDPACIAPILDVDPAAPGLQADCAFEDTVYSPGGGSPVTTGLPACDAASPPCWRLTDWPGQSCAVVEIDRGADWCNETLTTTRLECLTAMPPTRDAAACTSRSSSLASSSVLPCWL